MKFNVKHLMAVSAVALAMIGAGGAINANNNNVHADDTSDADAMFNDPSIMKDSEEDEKASNESEHEENEAAEPQRKQQAKEEMQDGFLDRDFYDDPVTHHYLRKLGYSNHQMKKGIAVDEGDNNNNDVHYNSKVENRLARQAAKDNRALAHSHNPDINNNYTRRHYGKGIKRSHHKRITKRTNRKFVNHKAKRNRKTHKQASKRTNKKLVNLIKHDKKILANKHARYFNRLIKRINFKHIRKSTKRALLKKINRKANRKYLNAYKDLVRNQKAISIK